MFLQIYQSRPSFWLVLCCLNTEDYCDQRLLITTLTYLQTFLKESKCINVFNKLFYRLHIQYSRKYQTDLKGPDTNMLLIPENKYLLRFTRIR